MKTILCLVQLMDISIITFKNCRQLHKQKMSSALLIAIQWVRKNF
nr:MAG TPA_asm: hypothetical protein [Caudoviricetes sp.]